MYDGPECDLCGDSNVSNDHTCSSDKSQWGDWKLKQLGIYESVRKPMSQFRIIQGGRTNDPKRPV